MGQGLSGGQGHPSQNFDSWGNGAVNCLIICNDRVLFKGKGVLAKFSSVNDFNVLHSPSPLHTYKWNSHKKTAGTTFSDPSK